MQNIFDGRYSKWEVPGFKFLVPKIQNVIKNFKYVTFTKFEPQKKQRGSWVDYYEKFPFALTCSPKNYDLVFDVEPSGQHHIFSTHSFGKYAEFPEQTVYLCGVATCCCILSTALLLADQGKSVKIIQDLCADSSEEAHVKGIDMLKKFSPMIEIVNSSDLQEKIIIKKFDYNFPLISEFHNLIIIGRKYAGKSILALDLLRKINFKQVVFNATEEINPFYSQYGSGKVYSEFDLKLIPQNEPFVLVLDNQDNDLQNIQKSCVPMRRGTWIIMQQMYQNIWCNKNPSIYFLFSGFNDRELGNIFDQYEMHMKHDPSISFEKFKKIYLNITSNPYTCLVIASGTLSFYKAPKPENVNFEVLEIEI